MRILLVEIFWMIFVMPVLCSLGFESLEVPSTIVTKDLVVVVVKVQEVVKEIIM